MVGPFTDAFWEDLRELGYGEGVNYVLDIHDGEANPDQLAKVAAELAHLRVDIIVTAGAPALRAAKKATRTIPIVMRMGGDPVKSGFVASLAHPGGNITGVAAISVELSGKRLGLIAETIPGINRVGVLTTTRNHTATYWYQEFANVAQKLGIMLHVLRARDPDTIDSAFLVLKEEHAQALVVIPSARYGQYGEHILRNAKENRLPAIYALGV